MTPLSTGDWALHTATSAFRFDSDLADKAERFFDLLVIPEGSSGGQPWVLIPWQRDIVRTVFGWVHVDSGLRRFTKIFMYVPRKNAKTTFSVVLGFCALWIDREVGSKMFIAAASRDQSAIGWSLLRNTVELSPRIKKYVVPRYSEIRIPSFSAVIRPLTGRGKAKHGLNPNVVVVDELHEWDDSGLLEALETSMGARAQPLLIHSTTADYDRPSICNTEYEYACGVRDRKIPDAHYLPVVCEADPDAPWDSPETWAAANPSLGITLNVEWLEQQAARARIDERRRISFMRLHLNLRVSAHFGAIPIDVWDSLPVAGNLPENVPIYVGIDIGGRQDPTAVAVGWWLDGRLNISNRIYVPGADLWQREQRDGFPYVEWSEAGYIHTNPALYVDYVQVEQYVLGLASTHETVVGVDRWAAASTISRLESVGIRVIPVAQGAGLGYSALQFVRMVRSGEIAHEHNPVVRWMVSNLQLAEENNGVKPVRPEDSRRKIDAAIAMIIALSAMLRTRTDDGGHEPTIAYASY